MTRIQTSPGLVCGVGFRARKFLEKNRFISRARKFLEKNRFISPASILGSSWTEKLFDACEESRRPPCLVPHIPFLTLLPQPDGHSEIANHLTHERIFTPLYSVSDSMPELP